MSDEGITWITVNGAHVPVKEGQDKGEAIKEHFAKKLAEAPDNPETVKQQMAIKKEAEKPFSIGQMVWVSGYPGYVKDINEKDRKASIAFDGYTASATFDQMKTPNEHLALSKANTDQDYWLKRNPNK